MWFAAESDDARRRSIEFFSRVRGSFDELFADYDDPFHEDLQRLLVLENQSLDQWFLPERGHFTIPGVIHESKNQTMCSLIRVLILSKAIFLRYFYH